jgi:cytochrome c5
LSKLSAVAVSLLLLVVAAPAAAQRVPPGTEAEMRERLRPVGEVCLRGQQCGAGTQPAAAAAGPGPAPAGNGRSGQQVYERYCFACHSTGAAAAPVLGDTAGWEPRIAQGMDVLMEHTRTGIGAMPPMGTCMDCSDTELEASVQYILDSLD